MGRPHRLDCRVPAVLPGQRTAAESQQKKALRGPLSGITSNTLSRAAAALCSRSYCQMLARLLPQNLPSPIRFVPIQVLHELVDILLLAVLVINVEGVFVN